MAELAAAYVQIIPSMRGMKGELERAIGGEKVGSTVGKKLGFSLSAGVKTAATGTMAAVGAGLGFALTKGMGRLVAIDNAKAKLRGLGNDAKTVEKVMENANASVRGTAFGLDEAATTAAGAMAAGIKPGQELERNLKLVADAATIAGTDMGSMGAIFNKVAASNKVQMDVINQLHDAGVPALSMLADQLGVTAEEASKMASRGEIDFATFQAAMEKGLGGAALSSGETFTGAMKNVGAALGRVGANLMGGVFPKIAPLFQSIQGALKPLEEGAKRLGDTIGTYVAPIIEKLTSLLEGGKGAFSGMGKVIAPLTGAFSALGVSGFAPLIAKIPGLSSLGGVLGKLGGPVGMLVLAFLGLVAASPRLREALGSAFKAILDAVQPLMPVLQSLAETVGSVLATAMEALEPILVSAAEVIEQLVVALQPLISAVAEALTPAIQALAPIVQNVLTQIQGVLEPFFEMVSSLLAAFSAAMTGDWSAMWESLKTVAASGWEVIKGLFSLGFSLIKGIVQAGWEAIKAVFSAAWNGLKNVVGAGVSAVVGLIKSLPGRALQALGNLGSFLVDSGKALINGFKNGIISAFRGVVDAVKGGLSKVRNLFPFSPAKEGPFSGKGWVLYSGLAIGDAMAEGIERSAQRVVASASSLAARSQAALAQPGMVSGVGFASGLKAAGVDGGRGVPRFGMPSTVVVRIGEREFTGYMDDLVSANPAVRVVDDLVRSGNRVRAQAGR